jgi:hypothetical protein
MNTQEKQRTVGLFRSRVGWAMLAVFGIVASSW